jgi:ATP-dependent protease Clp ATPase subunit
MTVCERIFRDLKFELPSTSVKRFVVTPQLVEHPRQELNKLLAAQAREERLILRQVVDEFARRFHQSHALRLRFTDAAAEALIAEALARGLPVRDLCAAKFKDYQFGLRLIAQNTNQDEFTIDKDAVAAPDQVLSDWVVASYRQA